jgi:hypothetical protein
MTDAVNEMETNQVGETFAKAIIENMTMKLSYGFAGGGRQAKEEEHGEELDATREGASEGEFRISLDDDYRQRPSRRRFGTTETWTLDILHSNLVGR